MIRLSTTNDKIQVVLAGNVTANQLDCFASWKEYTATTVVEDRNAPITNNTTDVDLVGSPAASTYREVDYLSVYNRDTANATVTIKFDINGTERFLFKATLSAGEKIEYCKDGFRVIANSGAIKTSINQGSNTVGTSLSVVVLGADVINNNATLNTIADVNGLSFPVVAGNTCYFEFTINYTAQATSTGSRWSINGPAFTRLDYTSEYTLTATTKTINNLGAYNQPAASNATSLASGNVATIWGFITPSANGNVVASFASEIANSAITAKAGSICRYIQVL